MEYAPLPTASQLEVLGRELDVAVFHERRINGGLGCTTDVLATADGRRLILRRHGPWWVEKGVAIAAREFAVLRVLRNHDLPVAEPLWASDHGVFDGPAIITEYLEGRGLLEPADPIDCGRQLADALVQVHAVDVGSLIDALDDVGLGDGSAPPPAFFEHPDSRRVLERLRSLQAEFSASDRTLIHGDFWPGNTLWREQRLVGIIDWEEAAIGDPAADVAYCSLDLRYMGLDEAADTVIETYRESTGRTLDTLNAWALYGLARPMPDIAQWVPAWEAMGLQHVDVAQLRHRHRALIEEAMLATEA